MMRRRPSIHESGRAGLIEKVAAVLEVDAAEFFRWPARPGSRRKAD
jgi:hypothetical protein